MRPVQYLALTSAFFVIVVAVACGGAEPVSSNDESAEAITMPSGPVGNGTDFEFDPTWPKPLPNNWTLGNVVGVDVDSNDHIWVVHRPLSLTPQEAALDADGEAIHK